MNTFKTLFTIALLGMSNLAMAEGSSLLDRAHSTMDEFQSSITDDTDQGLSAGSGQVGHSGGTPSSLSSTIANPTGDITLKMIKLYQVGSFYRPWGDERDCRNDYGGVVSGTGSDIAPKEQARYIRCTYAE